jgi:hypothetical protein
MAMVTDDSDSATSKMMMHNKQKREKENQEDNLTYDSGNELVRSLSHFERIHCHNMSKIIGRMGHCEN